MRKLTKIFILVNNVLRTSSCFSPPLILLYRLQQQITSKGLFHSRVPRNDVRKLNSLLGHEDPISYNLYTLIRALDIFDGIESYKRFHDDVQLILQPNGVLEFAEFDPRPRTEVISEDGEEENVRGRIAAVALKRAGQTSKKREPI